MSNEIILVDATASTWAENFLLSLLSEYLIHDCECIKEAKDLLLDMRLQDNDPLALIVRHPSPVKFEGETSVWATRLLHMFVQREKTLVIFVTNQENEKSLRAHIDPMLGPQLMIVSEGDDASGELEKIIRERSQQA